MSRRYTQAANYLLCRTLGHAWDPIPAESNGRLGGDPMWLRCERCLTERHDAVSMATGDLLTRQYVYAPSYRHAFDNQFADAAPTRQDFRLLLIRERIGQAREQRLQQQQKEKR